MSLEIIERHVDVEEVHLYKCDICRCELPEGRVRPKCRVCGNDVCDEHRVFYVVIDADRLNGRGERLWGGTIVDSVFRAASLKHEETRIIPILTYCTNCAPIKTEAKQSQAQ